MSALEFTAADVRALAGRLHGAAATPVPDATFSPAIVERVYSDLVTAAHLLLLLATALEAADDDDDDDDDDDEGIES